jgi:hypothetical protein
VKLAGGLKHHRSPSAVYRPPPNVLGMLQPPRLHLWLADRLDGWLASHSIDVSILFSFSFSFFFFFFLKKKKRESLKLERK